MINLLDRAIANVMTGPLEDFRKGRITQEKLEELTRRRQPLILAQLAEMRAPKAAARCACGAPATTHIDGADHCDAHAASAPRKPLPIRKAGA